MFVNEEFFHVFDPLALPGGATNAKRPSGG
jgi:hypothetical protein